MVFGSKPKPKQASTPAEIPAQPQRAMTTMEVVTNPHAAGILRSIYLSRMVKHIEEAEHWQQEVAALEGEAAKQTRAGNVPVGGRPLPPEYVEARYLDRPDYKRAVAIRASHQTRAQMYAQAAAALAPSAG